MSTVAEMEDGPRNMCLDRIDGLREYGPQARLGQEMLMSTMANHSRREVSADPWGFFEAISRIAHQASYP